MPRFIALTSRGLIDTLYEEMHDLGFDTLIKTPAGVEFETNWAGCYRANLQLRTATRILLTILDFQAYTNEDLYHNVRKHDYTKYIDPNQTVAVDANTDSPVFRDQRFVALKVKDAIVDQFRDKFGERPNVESKQPDLLIHVRININDVSVALDTSGTSLFKRGYRVETVEAPLKEHLAAGLVKMAGWDGSIPLLDPMCGSGTIVIEAALMALGVSPGSLRKSFGFQRWKTFQPEVFKSEIEAVMDLEKPDFSREMIFASDYDRGALLAARKNAVAAGVDEHIRFRRAEASMVEPPLLEPPAPKGIIVVNPPYGLRMGDVDMLKDSYRDLGFALRSRFKGWTMWLLSGQAELAPLLGLKSSRRIRLFNGPVECRFLKYDIR